jgi:hypothetical protein
MSDCPEWGSPSTYEAPLAGEAFLVAQTNELLPGGEATWSLTRIFQEQIVVVAAGIGSSLAEARSRAAAALKSWQAEWEPDPHGPLKSAGRLVLGWQSSGSSFC